MTTKLHSVCNRYEDSKWVFDEHLNVLKVLKVGTVRVETAWNECKCKCQ